MVPPAEQVNQAARRLRSARLKVTRPRLAVLQILMRDHGPFTVEELFGRIPKATCDLVTLYRSLPALEKAGMVRRCDFGDGSLRYEYQGEGADHHHHVICRRCREVRALEESLDESLILAIEMSLSRQGYRDVSHSLEFFALCARCSQ